MDEKFIFNARQFYDFSKTEYHDDEVDESYFEIEHEKHDVTNTSSNEFNNTKSVSEIDMEFFTPLKTTLEIANVQINLATEMRRSMSTGDINKKIKKSNNDVNNLCDAVDQLEISPQEKQRNSLTPEQNQNAMKERSRAGSREHLNKLAQPKRRYNSEVRLDGKKFVSMAEAVNKFAHKTPERFRSRPNMQFHPKFDFLKCTIPNSPNLITKNRSRPVKVLSNDEKEQMQLDEAKKYKIRAHPVNKKILQGPLKLPCNIERKITVPEPFKITSVPQKAKVSQSPKRETFHFHANPIPKSVYEPFKITQADQHFTIPKTPNFSKRFQKNSPKNKAEKPEEESHKLKKLTCTQPIPFSFEERDKLIVKKKEELINKVIEEEKKAREFHANPMPAFQPTLTRFGSCELKPKLNTNLKLNNSEDNLCATTFKAKPPIVLDLPPFQPKKLERPLIEITEFQLNTERRAKEREEFERKIKEKDEERARLKEMNMRMLLKMEEEEKANIRKETEYKAQPIKKYKELHIVPSNKITIPISPKFHFPKNGNKENIDG